MGYHGLKSVDLTTDRGFKYKGNLISYMTKTELYDALKDVMLQNKALRYNAKIQVELSKERLFGVEAQLKEMNVNRLIQQLKKDVRHD